MTPQRYAERRERLRALMHEKQLDALFISHEANRYYLSGFELHDPQKNESSGYLLICSDGRDWLCTDSRYKDAAARLWDTERVFIYTGRSATELNTLMRQLKLGRIGFEAKSLSVSFFEQLSEEVCMERADGLVEELRVIKEPEEVERMRRSCALNHRLMEAVPAFCRPGRTEADVAWDIEKFFRENGASGLAFDSIVAVGPNAALPHAIPGADRIVENCPVLIDVGCRVDDYCSDQTRTLWVGDRPSPAFQRTMELVRAAQDAAIREIRPGMKVADVHACARKVFEDAGVEAHFTHSLGHGVGLETHEAPGVSPRVDAELKPNMIITVEPGLYYPEWGGIRWEYMVLVTEGGAEIF
ncbi:Xaa-Pro peptidase family protein [Desulfovibrio mangrovi]|uniref:M24 family metallopeptidase n=1 Tax=Desulfovibrio mangrovi TaxID=2976983 RepID=UPI0022476A55|nr:Xaa-Pro peptidase family protein [Desulfovibrio mangrovi]UZP66400.1 Xaa-Pro peptidase family protein [Desulfovibrio mangrovi]